ncbi:LysR family transcriptional regulator [Nocardiopsis sp. FIRDI 009]|uniref:LysR family transcriptional regulator n=1 Tax=Nocardiopsis sp. FIRDI 009 TaxID=714197 RepID=UPI000E275347|nr:LysR family transcriptional regulator [Nocardiopsis sp. FIRDI 009]
MDLVGACRAFVSVSDRGSFTLGAAAARIPQPVASRRIAALERHLGARLFDRSARGAALTQFGRDMLPSARRLVELAEAMEHDAERARLAPVRLAVPDLCPTPALARLDAAARLHGLHLDFHPAPPERRAELLRTQQVRAAVTAVPGDEARWTVPLGLAGAEEPQARTVYLESLRAGRAERSAPRRVWVQPEDDVPHVRDRVLRVRDTVGLRPAQVTVASALTAAVAEVLGSRDLLLCSRLQSAELGLRWRPLGELRLVRGYELGAVTGDEAERIRERLDGDIARCLGARGTKGDGG